MNEHGPAVLYQADVSVPEYYASPAPVSVKVCAHSALLRGPPDCRPLRRLLLHAEEVTNSGFMQARMDEHR